MREELFLVQKKEPHLNNDSNLSKPTPVHCSPIVCKLSLAPERNNDTRVAKPIFYNKTI